MYVVSMHMFVYVCFYKLTKEEGCVETGWVKRPVGSRLYRLLNAWLRSLACEPTVMKLWTPKSPITEVSERNIDFSRNGILRTASEEKHVL